MEIWDQINEAVLKVVPITWAETRLVQKHHHYIQCSNRKLVKQKSVDETSRRGQNLWLATQDVESVTYLNKIWLESDCLLIYEGSPMRITSNILKLHATQVQLCVVKKVTKPNNHYRNAPSPTMRAHVPSSGQIEIAVILCLNGEML